LRAQQAQLEKFLLSIELERVNYQVTVVSSIIAETIKLTHNFEVFCALANFWTFLKLQVKSPLIALIAMTS
jgi:hypothetical protein